MLTAHKVKLEKHKLHVINIFATISSCKCFKYANVT